MSSLLRYRVFFAIVVGLVFTALVWLILDVNSPFGPYFLIHLTVPNVARRIHTLPYLVVAVLRPKTWVNQISYGLIFVQWAVVGFLLSMLFVRKTS